jgi:catechol 2,3-dioxygenase-like lactoylglutathione lyase family enzyme
MSDAASGLPARPSLEQLRKRAKERLAALRATDPAARLADAQLALARDHGFASWTKLVAHVSALDPRAAEPRITAPVSRLLGTNDRDAAVRFWRDVLGFDVRGAGTRDGVDLVSGRARVRLGDCDWGPDFSEGSRAPGAAIVFFETDDLEAMHATIRRRGGTPGEVQKVNGLKVRMFEIRDPDGHVIWFGQSYHEPSPRRPRGLLQRVMPELPCDDVPSAVRHYVDALGFSVNYEQADLGVLDRDDIRLLLVARTAEHSGIGSAYIYVRDVDALHAQLLDTGANLQGEPVSQPWGLREFSVLDIERNRLTFGQPFE